MLEKKLFYEAPEVISISISTVSIMATSKPRAVLENMNVESEEEW